MIFQIRGVKNMRSYKLKPKAILKKSFFVLILFVILSLLSPLCTAQSADEYAPIFYFESEENCYPVSVEYLFDNIGGYDNYDAIDIEGDSVQFYDNPQGTVEDNGVINDYSGKMNHTIYYQISSIGGTSFIQYWMFYAFNDGEHNRHEGDWEMVEIVIPSGEEKWVAYSQHYSGQRATWNQVEKDGNNIKVYVARGSHANYLRSYSGKIGMASDTVGDNGKILQPTDYNLVELNSQPWLTQDVFWGEINNASDFLSGTAGPQGPQYRQDMNGNLMWDGISWGSSLMQADDTMFMLEWFLYNFVMIFLLITLLLLALIVFRIYRRHKKYGLGPKIVSMLYIDGLNLKSIGNILCFVGIVIAIVGLFNQWYTVSADINVEGFTSTGMIDILSIDGLNGVQITMPGSNGPTPMGTVIIPFYLFILIGFIFMILAAIGINRSKKLGTKYLFRGIKLMLIVIVILIAIMSIGMLAGNTADSGGAGSYISDFLNALSGSPMGGEDIFTMGQGEVTGQVTAKWGLGLGGLLLLISGIVFLIAGILEIFANQVFFEPKIPIEKKKKKDEKPPEKTEDK